MSSESNKRSASRQPNAAYVVLIDAPSHSDSLLEPMDVSLGGFKIRLSKKPELGEVIACSIDIMNRVFEGCQMTVARVEENQADSSWAVGMSLEVPENVRNDFQDALREALPEVH